MGGFSFAVTNAVLRKYKHTPSESRMLAMFGGSGLMAACAALAGMSQAIVPAPALAAGRHSHRAGAGAGLHGQQCRPAVRRRAPGLRHHGHRDADRNPVCQPVLGRAGRRRTHAARAAGRQPDRAGRRAGGHGTLGDTPKRIG
jgi:hypothetical protein